jgi:tetratricopeptide (TPR) repeat protein
LTNKLKESICDWCCGGSILDCGIGCFRDVDSDFSYGIPVCGGCGGLGRQIKNDDFEARRERILKLRFEYCPTDNEEEATIGVKVKKLEALINEVTELFKIYGKEGDKSYAKEIADGLLRPLLKELRKARDEIVEIVAKLNPKGVKNPEAFRQAFIAAYSGDLDKADEIFKKIIEEDPLSSVTIHDYASYIVQFHRSYKDALPWFKKSLQLKPKKAIHFFQTIKCMLNLKLFGEAREIFPEAYKLCRAQRTKGLMNDLKTFKRMIDKELSQNN